MEIASFKIVNKNQWKEFVDKIETQEKEIASASTFIKEIEEGNLETIDVDHADHNSLTGSLVNMRNKMKIIAQEEKERNWITEGLAKFSDILRSSNNDLSKLCNDIVSELVKYMNANQGGLYLVNDNDPSNAYIELIAAYAYNRKKYIDQRIAIGHGLIGQAVLEKETIYMTDVPADYVKITSGLGEATPRNIIIVPLKVEDKVYGLVELASFQEIKKHQKQFLEKLSETLASTIASVRTTEHTQNLLKETQLQAEQLKAQEEEMRQNMEELNATQEAMAHKQQEAIEEANKLNAILNSSSNAIVTIDKNGIVESVNKSFPIIFGYDIEETIGQSVEIILPLPSQQNRDGYLKNFLINLPEVIGKTQHVMRRRKDGNTFHAEVSVSEVDLGNRTVYTAIIHDITNRYNAEQERLQQIEELRAQEEELRQNMEELQAIQEEMQKQMNETFQLKQALEERERVFSLTTILSESDLHGTVTLINDKFCEVSKYSREELIGKAHNILRDPDMPKELFKILWQTIKAGNVFKGIVKNRAKDGTHYWVDATIVPIKNEKGENIKYIGARYHITNEAMALQLYNEQAQKFGWPLLEENLLREQVELLAEK